MRVHRHNQHQLNPSALDRVQPLVLSRRMARKRRLSIGSPKHTPNAGIARLANIVQLQTYPRRAMTRRLTHRSFRPERFGWRMTLMKRIAARAALWAGSEPGSSGAKKNDSGHFTWWAASTRSGLGKRSMACSVGYRAPAGPLLMTDRCRPAGLEAGEWGVGSLGANSAEGVRQRHGRPSKSFGREVGTDSRNQAIPLFSELDFEAVNERL